MRDPKTEPIPAPDPATPTVAAPAPMNLAAESMSCLAAEGWMRLVACRVAGLMLLQAAMPRRGETERRAIADMIQLVWSGRWSGRIPAGTRSIRTSQRTGDRTEY